MKKYIIIAGVNGAGKSTLFQTIDSLKEMPRVNVDETIKEIGDWKKLEDVFHAGKIVVKKIAQYFDEGITFNQETTLCGHGIPEEDIEKRYQETFKQLNTLLKECNLIAFYDNTESFRRFAICKNGELVRVSKNVPEWFSKVEAK